MVDWEYERRMHMFEFDSYLRKPSRVIKTLPFYIREAWITKEVLPECFVHIDDEDELHRLNMIDRQCRFFVGAVVLKYKGETMTGLDLYETGIWKGYFQLIEEFKKSGFAKGGLYGYKYLVWESLSDNRMRFTVQDSRETHYTRVIPEKEFLEAVLNGLLHFYEKLVQYGNLVERNRDTIQLLQALR